MNLFSEDATKNLLPYDGTVEYLGNILSKESERRYYEALFSEILWKQDEAVLFGKRITTKRKVAWYADAPFAYAYSGTVKEALPWTENLLTLKTIVESLSECSFNSCLLNLYHTGDEGMAWHSDDEKAMGKESTIASVSLGAERRFLFRHKKTKHTVSLVLEPGSLLLMKGSTQSHWLHALPKMKRVLLPRINLTFRQYKAI